MMLKKVAITFLLLSCLMLLAGDARSQTLASARILSSEGAVEIQRPSPVKGMLTKISYAANDELFAGDLIRTFKGGRLVLGLTDGSQAIIGEQSIVQITDTNSSPRTFFNVLRGRTRVKIEKVGGRPNPYRVNTPTTVIAVRGTLFDVIVTDSGTEVFVHEGEVAVSNLTKPDVTVILSPGMRTRVRHAQLPESPTRFQPGRNDNTFRSAEERNGQRKDGAGRGKDGAGEGQKQDQKQQPGQQQLPQGSPNPPQRPSSNEGQRQEPPPSGKPNSKRERDERIKREQFFADKD